MSSRPRNTLQGFAAEKGGPHLTCQVVQSQAQGTGRGLEFQLELPETIVPIAPDIEHAIDIAQRLHELLGDTVQSDGVGVKKLHVNGKRQFERTRRKNEGFHSGYRSRLFSPRLLEVAGDQVTFHVGKRELDSSDMAAWWCRPVAAKRIVQFRGFAHGDAGVPPGWCRAIQSFLRQSCRGAMSRRLQPWGTLGGFCGRMLRRGLRREGVRGAESVEARRGSCLRRNDVWGRERRQLGGVPSPAPAGPAAPLSPFDFPQGERPLPCPSGFLPAQE